MAHQCTPIKFKIDENGDYLYWQCDCGAIGGEPITSEELQYLLSNR